MVQDGVEVHPPAHRGAGKGQHDGGVKAAAGAERLKVKAVRPTSVQVRKLQLYYIIYHNYLMFSSTQV